MLPCKTRNCKMQATWKVYIGELDYVHSCTTHVPEHQKPGFEAVELFPVAVRTNVYKKGRKSVNK